MKRELILGQIPNDFDPRYQIPISPACFIGKENIYPDWENLLFESDPFLVSDYEMHANLTTNYSVEFLHEFYEELNEMNNLNCTYDFWKIVAMPFLLSIVQTLYEREKRLINFINKYKGEKLIVKIPMDNIDWNFSSTLDFQINGQLNINYNEWLYSRILESMTPDSWEIKYIDKSTQLNKIIIQEKKSLKEKAFNKVFFRTSLFQGFNLAETILIHFILLFKKPIIKGQVRFKSADKLSFNQNKLFSTNFYNILIKSIPKSIKNLKSNYPAITRRYKKGKLIFGSQFLFYDEIRKLDYAIANQNGELLIAYQHGGHSYGSTSVDNFLREIEFNNFKFITWGWVLDNQKLQNFTPLPCPFLSKISNSHKQRNENIILVGTAINVLSYRIDSFFQSNDAINYRKNKLIFIRNLNKNVTNNLFYRPYFESKNKLLDSYYFQNKKPELKFLKTDNFHKEIFNCKLLILDHPGTTWNIGLAANIPMICFWDKKWFPFDKKADEFLNKFRDVGIYYESPFDAAVKVNELIKEYKTITTWWNQIDIQELRNNWCFIYARVDSNWRFKWYNYLREL